LDHLSNMKRCPECRRDYYDETLLYCLDDGTALLEGPALGDRPATAILHDTASPGEAETRYQRGRPGTIVPQTRNTGKSARWAAFSSVKIALAVGIFALAAAGVFFGYRYYSSRGGQSAKTSADLKIQRLTGNGKIAQAAISPDGKFLAYIQVEAGQESLWVKQISTNSSVEVVAPALVDRFWDLTFPPNGDFIYFTGKNAENPVRTIFRVPTLGGTLQKGPVNAYGLSISPDGKEYVFTSGDPNASDFYLSIAGVDGSGQRRLATRGGKQFFNSTPLWSPDGLTIFCPIGDDTQAEHRLTIAAISASDGSLRELSTYKWDDIERMSVTPDMTRLVFSADATGGGEGVFAIWQLDIQSGESRRLTQDVIDYTDPTMTADGKTLVVVQSDETSSLWISPNAGVTRAVQITTGKDSVSRGFAWTPDKKIVYVSRVSGNTELWKMDPDGSNKKQLTNDGRIKYTPVVTSDGRYIVFAASQGASIWRVNIDGSNPVPLVAKTFDAANPDITPDSQTVIFSSWTDGKLNLWRIPIDGGEPQRITEFASTEPNISPDGKMIACFSVDANSVIRLTIIPVDGGEPLKAFEMPPSVFVDASPKWTPDGRGITFIDIHGSSRDLWVQPFDGGAPKRLTDFKENAIYRREWTRDGKQVAIVRGESSSDAVMITGF
jgi:Tol biopolymer transport system component